MQIKRWHLIGEVRYVWPDTTSAKAQIQFASLIEAMKNKNMSAVVRWVLKDQAEPVIGICVPMHEFPGEGKRIDYMFWVKVSAAQ
jgi:ATP-dependent DNA helicase 2 subunit 2